MKRISKWSVVLSLLLIGLAACQPATPEVTLAPPPTATATVVPTSTNVPLTATPVPSPTAEPTSGPPPADATPTREPVAEVEATPTRPWQIPSLMDGDHGKGNPDAGLVLVEYSDFQ